MGKSKPRRPAPPMAANPSRHSPLDVTAPRREPVRVTWRQMGWGVLVVLLLTGVWWYGVRPQSMIRQARTLMATDPRAAAELLEDAAGTTLFGERDAQVQWARALIRAGQADEALGCFGMIEHPELAREEGLIELADDAQQAQLPLLAVLSLEAIPLKSPHRRDVLPRLLGIQQLRGNHDAALKLAAEWSELEPKSPAPWLAMAHLHMQQLSVEDARADYLQALTRELETAPRAVIQRALVGLHLLLGEREEARKLQTEIRHGEATPTSEDHLHEAQLRRMEGDIAGAWTEVQRAVQGQPDDPIALELRGTLAADRQEYAAAESDFQTIVRQQPWNKAVHYKLAQTLAILGRDEEAATHFAENRRLLKLSNRILELQQRGDLTEEETAELAWDMEQTGMKGAAERLRQK